MRLDGTSLLHASALASIETQRDLSHPPCPQSHVGRQQAVVTRRHSFQFAPEAALGGPMALVKSGDEITIDAERREICLHVSAAELKRRRKGWKAPKPYARRGALAKYAKQVSSASLGAVTDQE